MCIHGGGWTSGTPPFFFPHCRYFASRGAVAFSIQYRLADEKRSNLADCLADARAALRFIRANAERFGIDPERIAVVGDSAGGHLAACLGTIPDPAEGVSSRPNAMLLYNPVLDLTTLDWTQKLPDAASLSPMLHVEGGQPPTLLMHGTEDKSVPVEQARRFAAAMAKAGNRCDLVILDGIAHAFVLAGYTAPESTVVEAIRAGDRFLASLGYLDGEPTLRFRKGRPAKTKLFDIQ